LEDFKGKPDGRIAGNCGGLPASLRYICQGKAWVDHRDIKNWIDQVWTPFALEKGDMTYLLMDEFSVHLIASCSNQIKGCETTIDYIIGGYTSKFQVIDVGFNKLFKGYIRQAYENFMIGNIENRKIRREDIVQRIEIGWEKMKMETISRTWTKVGIEIVTTAI
jgi:DDE superfamily endonuclease